jgi:hypothetical protein
MNMPGSNKNSFVKRGFRKILEIGQRLGLNIMPVHFYSGIPYLWELKQSEYWRKPKSMIGINGTDIASQLDFVGECCSQNLVERQKSDDIYDSCCRRNGEPGFGRVEADFLYCFIFSKRPQKIIQVGAGLSTAVILLAAKEASYNPEITCIDPHPNTFLKEAHQSNEIRLISEKAQLIDLDSFTDLGREGFLFVDSTHTVKPGSEVNFLILEVLPRLPMGSWVHFHDIYFPYDYPRDILSDNLFFPNETPLLHAFLIDNQKYKIRAALGMLHYANPAELQSFLPNYNPSPNNYGMRISKGHFPSSAYLQAVK